MKQNELTASEGKVEFFYTVEGKPKPISVMVDAEWTVDQLTKAIESEMSAEVPLIAFKEDGDKPLAASTQLKDLLASGFPLLHLSRRVLVRVTVMYQDQKREKDFQPSATVKSIVAWAVGPHGFGLKEDPSEFDLKHGDEVLPNSMHIGQLGSEHVQLSLVFKSKHQG